VELGLPFEPRVRLELHLAHQDALDDADKIAPVLAAIIEDAKREWLKELPP